jgi:hypothetical protein
MKKTGFTLVLAALTGLLLKSCTKDKVSVPVVTAVTDTISYSQKVQPLIEQNCSTTGCHDAGTAQNGYNLSNYTGIRDNAEDMLNAMRGQNGFALMPPGGPMLPDSSILQFEAWIAQGKLDN